MEYAASVWDPYHLNDIQALEKVQRRAARWVMNDYSWYSSVSAMLHSLNWPSLQLRRRISRLQTFYKATYKLSALSIPSYFLPAQRLTRHYSDHPLHYIDLSPIQELVLTSSPTIQEQLEIGMSFHIILNNLQSFTSSLTNYYCNHA